MSVYKFVFLVVSINVFVSSSSFASNEIKLEPIEIIANYDNAVASSDSASQGAVSGKLIGGRPILRTGEILEFVPGMIVSQHSGSGKANQYYLRGFNLDHGTDFATYVDEIPVNMRTHAHGQGYTDLNFIIPELINSIDYKKGPYFADEGDFASAGAAHLRLADKLPQGIASISLGNYGYQRGVLANSIATDNGNLLYGLEINRNNGPWDNPEQVRKYSGILRYSGGTRDDGFSLTAMVYHNQWNATDQIPLRAVSSGQTGRFGAIDPTDGGESSRYSLSYAMHQRNKDSLFKFNAYVVQSQLDLFSNVTYFLNDPVNGDQFNQSEKRRVVGFNVSNTWFNNLAGFDMQNKLGLQTRYDYLSPVSLYNTIAKQRLSTIRQDQVQEASAGIYAENSTQWLDKFRTLAGVRYDQYYFDVDSSIQVNSGKVHDGIASPKLSFIFGPWAKTEYFINFGNGFHSNDARGTTQTQRPSGGPSDPVNPLVRTKGKEVAIRTEIITGLQSSFAFWRLDSDSELVFVGDAGETEPSRASRRQGIEWNNHYIANSWLLLDFDIAASKANYTENAPAGNRIPGSINQVASFGATLTDLGDWSAALKVRYFGPRPLIEDNSVRSKSTMITYARVGYKINPRTNFTLDIFNLFNQKDSDIDYYYPSRLPGEPTAGVADIHFHPVEPRSARLNLAFNL